MTSGRTMFPTIAPPAWPAQLQSSTWSVSPTIVDGGSQGPTLNHTVARYFALASFRGLFTFAGFVFLSPFVESLAQNAVILAFLLLVAELLTAHRSLKASDMEAKRAWTIANLALFIAVFMSLIVGIAAPASLKPFPPGSDRRGEPAPLIVRTPTIWAFLATVGAGFTLPAVRVRNWRRGLDSGVDKFPGVDAPVHSPASTAVTLGSEGFVGEPAALEQPYSDSPDSQRTDLSGMEGEGGALADAFAIQNNA
ncbi:uncharacterized protein PgNI_07127 [Pyricularia grisea]|uniref:Uncharacterized protein n=1 Tax=Pyricularia grisea TaxID=148305 RepID=A0A6P8B0Q8_PYRGI|nr:uncharacterized protein PgNI_07127 [Pyricularia grisea]TLD08490.1 hypothetical protein PgNI_07127 [Pyricularia grisea]